MNHTPTWAGTGGGLIVVTHPHNGLDIEGQTSKFLSDVTTLFRANRVLQPFCLIQAQRPEPCLLAVTLLTELIGMEQAVHYIRLMTADTQADALWFAYEAWGAPIRQAYDAGKYEYGDVAKHSARFELVGVNRELILNGQHSHTSWTALITRKHRPVLEAWKQVELNQADVVLARLSYMLVHNANNN